MSVGTKALWEMMLLDSYGPNPDTDRYLKPLNQQHLPNYSAWGCYPVIYLTDGGSILCGECATRALYQLEDEFDPPVAADVYWEGPATNCDDCNRVIESAYGDPDEPEE